MPTACALILQTQDNCPPGLVGDWASSRGLELDVLRVDRWDRLPDPSEYDCAIALGSTASLAGPWPEWVTREVEWIRHADAAGVPVLGICFGAQALAVALGGGARRLPSPEVAWITFTASQPERVPPGPWVALHEDSILAPPGAQELARNDTGLQAFSLGRHLGVQFHPEATRSVLSRWIADRNDLAVEARVRLVAGASQHESAAKVAAVDLFDGFAAQAGLAVRAVA